MAKAIKKAKKAKRPDKYEEKSVFTGNFKDIMQAAVKQANDKSAKKST